MRNATRRHVDLSFREGLQPLLFVVFVSTFFFMARSSMSPLLLDVEEAFGVGHAQSSGLMVLFTVGYALTMVVSGFVSARLTHRVLIPFAAVVGAFGTAILSVAGSMAMMRVGLFVFGTGFGLFAPTGINMVTTVIRRKDWQRALSIHELSPHAGMILAPLLVAALRPVLPWRGVFALLTALFLLSALLFVSRVKAGDSYGRAPSPQLIGHLFSRPAFWLLIVFFALALSGTDGVYLLVPTFLVTEAGIEPRLANAVFGISRFMPVLSLSIAALIADRFGPRYTITVALVGSGLAVVVLGASTGWLRIVTVFLQPAIGAIFFPAGFAAVSALLPAESRNVGISMVLPISVVLGVGVLPAFVGYMGEVASFSRGFMILGAATVVLGAMAMLVHFYED
jgi:NNP family nitrate/nitrite transporter-like MFS transporter